MKLEHIEEIARCFHVYDVPEHDRIRICADYGRIEAADTPLHALRAVYAHCEHHYKHRTTKQPEPLEFCHIEGGRG